jgi:hypothetical protein
MKRLQLIMTMLSKDAKVQHYERIEANDLVQLITQFQLVIAQIHRLLMEEAKREYEIRVRELQGDDDIPF